MNDTSTVATLVRKAGRWAVLGTAFAAFSIAASSCKKDDAKDDNGSAQGGDGNNGTAGTGNENGGAAGAVAEDPFSELREACPDLSEDLADCGNSGSAAKQLKVNMLVVLDKSGSMTGIPEEGGYNQSMWDAVSTALTSVLGDAADRIDFALELYPSSGDADNPVGLECRDEACCVMPSNDDLDVPFDEDTTAVGASTSGEPAIDRIISTLGETSPGGGTPTAEALRRARRYLQAANLDGDTYVLLATDGGPNCNADATCGIDECTMNIDGPCITDTEHNCCEPVPIGCLDADDTTAAIEDLLDDDVKTYVVGIPGSEPYVDALNAFAQAGGVPSEGTATSYYRVSASGGATALKNTFKQITEQLVTSCTIPLAAAPPDPNRVNVAINCTLIPQKNADEEAQWEFSENDTVITILGDECAAIEAEGAQRVDVLQDCPPLGIF